MANFELSLNGEEYINISPDPDPGHLILEGGGIKSTGASFGATPPDRQTYRLTNKQTQMHYPRSLINKHR